MSQLLTSNNKYYVSCRHVSYILYLRVTHGFAVRIILYLTMHDGTIFGMFILYSFILPLTGSLINNPEIACSDPDSNSGTPEDQE